MLLVEYIRSFNRMIKQDHLDDVLSSSYNYCSCSTLELVLVRIKTVKNVLGFDDLLILILAC